MPILAPTVWRLSLATTAAIACAVSAHAAAALDRPVDDRSLEQERGGFALPDSGINLSFGVQQAVYVNGTLAATSNLQVSQNNSQVSGTASGPVLVQLGSTNNFSVTSTGAAGAGIVVQNSLNNQSIQTVTNINVSATLLSAYNNMNLQSALRSAITNSLRR
jgi:hypothetical protein